MKYRPEIDGLRTLAVIPVIFFHLGYTVFIGGYYGVDVFFVISGYLITSIITNNIRDGKFSMYGFWIRRVKRLVPLLLTVSLVMLLITPLVIFRPSVRDLSKDVAPAVFSYFNFHALLNFGNYWGGKSEKSFFLHTWSLSVEEQFYLIFPIFLFITYKYLKNFTKPILVITIISFFFFQVYLKISKDITFYMLPTRVWELSIGGLAGLLNIRKNTNSITSIIFSITGVLLILYAYFYGEATIGNEVIFPVLGTILIILFCSPTNILGKMLSAKLFVFIGLLSYSLYLWHSQVIVLFRHLEYQLRGINKDLINVIIVLITAVLSYLTYYLVENKTRNYKRTPQIVISGILIVIGISFFYNSGYFNIYYPSAYNKQTYYLRYYDISPTPVVPEDKDPLTYNVQLPQRPSEFKEAYKNEGIVNRVNNKDPEIVLLGDSHGVMWAKLIDDISKETELSLSIYTSNGAKPFFNIQNIDLQEETGRFNRTQRIAYGKSIIRNLETWKPKMFILACKWDDMREIDMQYLHELLSLLQKSKIKILLFTQPPKLKFMVDNNASQYFTYLGIAPVPGYNLIDVTSEEEVNSNDYIKSLKSKYDNVIIYDVYKSMIEESKIKVSKNSDMFYFDDDHLSYSGTYFHKQNIVAIIKENINQGLLNKSQNHY